MSQNNKTVEKARLQREARYQAGLCVDCGKSPHRPERKTCTECGGRRARYMNDYQKHPERSEKYRNYQKDWRLKRRMEALAHYGGKCACCGEAEPAFLVIDHIDGGGNKHRKEVFGRHEGHGPFIHWLWKNNFPPGFQVLCANCNTAKAYHPVCPHQIH